MQLKQSPEDFIVEERINLKIEPGPYTYLKITKRNWNTEEVATFLVRKLNLPRKNINYAGLKDKKALTTQYFSILNMPQREMDNPDLTIEIVGTGKQAIQLGDLLGNKFRIRVEHLLPKMDFLINYFGEQRFSKNNVAIGKAILKKDWKQACELIDDEKINQALHKEPTNTLGALTTLDKRMLSLYLHAVQAEIWNQTVVKLIKKEKHIEDQELCFIEKKKEFDTLPLLSFETDLESCPYKEELKQTIKEMEITQKDFITRSIPGILPTSSERSIYIPITEWKQENNWVEFFLPKGSYATMVIRQGESFLKAQKKER